METIALLLFAVLVAFYATDTGLMLAGQSDLGQKSESGKSNTTDQDGHERWSNLPAVDEKIRDHCLHMEYLTSEMKVFKKNYRATPLGFTSYGYFAELSKNEIDGTVSLSYTYNLPFPGQKATFHHSFRVSETSQVLDGYGVDQLNGLNPGFTRSSPDSATIDFDYLHIVNLVKPFSSIVARHIREMLSTISKTSLTDRVETVRYFVNHLPYGIPDFNAVDLPPDGDGTILKRFYYGELALMPEIMVLSYGDCDSKSILMAGILSELIDSCLIALVTCLAPDPSNPGGFGPHMMVGVAGLPYKKTTRIQTENAEYHLIESTCPYPDPNIPFVVKDPVAIPLHTKPTVTFRAA